MLHWFLFGFAYTVVYLFSILPFFLAFDNFRQFEKCCSLGIVASPFITWILVIIVLSLLNSIHKPRVRYFIIITLIIHYLLTVFFAFELMPTKDKFLLVWARSSTGIVFSILCYLFGQFYIWIAIFTSLKIEKPQESKSLFDL